MLANAEPLSRTTRNSEYCVRPARKDDAEHLARLINYAGEGLPLHFWGNMAETDQDAWDVGFQRARRESGSFSYRNARVALVDGEVASMLITYTIGDTPEDIGPETPAAFVPLTELENMALGTEYVNVLATYHVFRGMGLGTMLLKEAEKVANGRALSIIVSNGNTNAMSLYTKFGFKAKASRPIVRPEGWWCNGTDWVLMIKSAR